MSFDMVLFFDWLDILFLKSELVLQFKGIKNIIFEHYNQIISRL